MRIRRNPRARCRTKVRFPLEQIHFVVLRDRLEEFDLLAGRDVVDPDHFLADGGSGRHAICWPAQDESTESNGPAPLSSLDTHGGWSACQFQRASRKVAGRLGRRAHDVRSPSFPHSAKALRWGSGKCRVGHATSCTQAAASGLAAVRRRAAPLAAAFRLRLPLAQISSAICGPFFGQAAAQRQSNPPRRQLGRASFSHGLPRVRQPHPERAGLRYSFFAPPKCALNSTISRRP
jgi:hypothetical protein